MSGPSTIEVIRVGGGEPDRVEPHPLHAHGEHFGRADVDVAAVALSASGGCGSRRLRNDDAGEVLRCLYRSERASSRVPGWKRP